FFKEKSRQKKLQVIGLCNFIFSLKGWSSAPFLSAPIEQDKVIFPTPPLAQKPPRAYYTSV
ncbi:MAG: hypothetical protein SPF67_03180, partial [Eubacteriales bacterium]|nr:hypothetical protein [Eubacterium sp.]MDY5493545.1 hypothetical protein [Eubacteriales bacterium]